MTKIFLLDDDSAVTEILKIIIEDKKLGTVADICHNPLDALESLTFSMPDIVIVDLLMPDLDGISFVKKARKKLPDAAFVMLSQVSDKEMISRAYTAGIEFFIQKPVNGIEVINVLQKVIKTQSLERAAQSAKTLLEQLSAPIFDDDMSSDTDIKVNRTPSDSVDYEAKLRRILQKLGILGERGSNDIITVVCYLCENDMDLNETTLNEICNRYSDTPKSMEQRIRRAAMSCLSNIAHMGLDDYGNEVFEEFSANLFRFEQVRKEMDFIKGISEHHGNVQIKRFIIALVNACMEE